MLQVNMDPEQEEILRSVQVNKMTSVASGTARGKDFVSAVAGLCFLYLTPRWDEKGELIENTKVAMTAPTDRQVGNIMFPEIARIFNRAKFLPGRLTGYDIRTPDKEWFLTGFKADEHNHEAWSGFHAANTMFIVTEATGISESVFNAIEGNLQGNSRILIVFNPNVATGYAAASQKSPRWHRFRLDSLNAPNVLQKKQIIPGQVDYEWVKDKVQTWCTPIAESDFLVEEGDFEFEGQFYRPDDLFRVKVRGMFPKISQGVLVPPEWIELANKNWKLQQQQGWKITAPLRLGNDVAGMGRDSSVFCYRFGNYVEKFEKIQSGGTANHMQIVGMGYNILKKHTDTFIGKFAQWFIDTIGEGAGVYSRALELADKQKNAWMKDPIKVHSVKFSESAEWQGNRLKDKTGQYEFANMRAYLFWAIRDWLNPLYKTGAMLPPNDDLFIQLTETKWEFMSNGAIKIEPKEEYKKRNGKSPDELDGLANTFYPVNDFDPVPKKKENLAKYFF